MSNFRKKPVLNSLAASTVQTDRCQKAVSVFDISFILLAVN
jgi:hypothetical protein